MTSMKAIEYTQYGAPNVLRLTEATKPTPKDNELLVKIHATTVTATECTFRQGKPLFSRLFTGLTRPRITRLGNELAGEVEAVGKDVTRFKPGDQIFGTTGPEFGAYAEYLCLAEDEALVLKPAQISYEEATSCDGVLTALPFLRDGGKLQRGQKVLINGASGSIGTAAVQLAKYLGAEVTGVCSTSNLELVKSLGADAVIDYTQEDFTQNGQTYDIIFDTVGKLSFSRCKGSLTERGIFLEAGITLGILPSVLWTAKLGSKKAKIMATGLRPASEKIKDLHLLTELMETGQFKPVIDRRYAMTQIVEAHHYVDQGHKKGNVILTI